jgi:hypothetical protein
MNTLQEIEQAISTLSHNQLLELQNWLNQYSIAQIKISKQSIHPDLSIITGILPVNLDVQAEYHQHLLKKHQQ